MRGVVLVCPEMRVVVLVCSAMGVVLVCPEMTGNVNIFSPVQKRKA
jgi:hypothetical protein